MCDGYHFSAHRALDYSTDFLQARVEIDPFLGHQAGIGCHAIHDAHVSGLANFINVRGIDVKLHARSINRQPIARPSPTTRVGKLTISAAVQTTASAHPPTGPSLL